ncbi:hypothetical protein RF11_04541 [Thelohanellus kitauei]|uniref:ATP-dependent DNA helicase n=1 Tax=Thelohanellus kitauei TaxID=669202 RepID=A0A0C2MU29_THEKT|nr:hypothetical protein RF11_04541 [Thelohanellus kitauei]
MNGSPVYVVHVHRSIQSLDCSQFVNIAILLVNPVNQLSGQVCATYREACKELNILENDAHRGTTLSDAFNTAHPQKILALFSIVLTTCFPSNPKVFWEKYKDFMSEDIQQRQCLAISNKTSVQLGIIAPNRSANDTFDRDLQREIQFGLPLEAQEKLFGFPLYWQPCDQKNIAMAIVSSGIAETLLDETPTCNINKNSGMAKVLRSCEIIIWDDRTMVHKKALESLHHTLKDLRSNERLFGGALILSGDFRQTLPVIRRLSAADKLNTCLKSSDLWRHFQKLSLKINMRVETQNDAPLNVSLNNYWILEIRKSKSMKPQNKIYIRRYTVTTHPTDTNRYTIRLQTFAVSGETCIRNGRQKSKRTIATSVWIKFEKFLFLTLTAPQPSQTALSLVLSQEASGSSQMSSDTDKDEPHVE